MKVFFDSVSIESLSILQSCLESRRSELALSIRRLRSEYEKLIESNKTCGTDFDVLKDTLEEQENQEFLLLDLLKQL